MKRGHLFAALMGMSSPGFVHVDTAITFSAEGVMDTIPAQFAPAQLRVAFSAPGRKQAVASVTLRLGEHVTTLPSCIVALLPSRRMAQVSASGSWYHDERGGLPYYLGIDFAGPRAVPARRRQTQVFMLFNLRTAKIIHIRRAKVDPVNGTRGAADRGILQRCSAQELEAVFDPARRLNAQ